MKSIKLKRNGFTLIELLVVIAIISILAAILFPVFARARENARRASCMSNLKQIGIGVMMYVQDYDETYPMSLNYGANGTYDANDVSWVDAIQPYVKSTQVFYCPSTGYQSPYNGNYGTNEIVMPFSTSTPSSIKMAAVNSPSQLYLIFDYGTYYASYWNVSTTTSGGDWNYLPGAGENGTDTYCSNITAVPGEMDRLSDCNSGRHFDGVNVVFADGHVKWLRSSVMVDESRKGNLGAWNYPN